MDSKWTAQHVERLVRHAVMLPFAPSADLEARDSDTLVRLPLRSLVPARMA
jgi:hypothetical protein